MTIIQLMKHLDRLLLKHGNRRVSVVKSELDDGNGTYDVCDISTVLAEFVPLVDGDGFQEYTKAGVERGAIRILLGNR